MEMLLRSIFAALLGSPRANVVAAGQGVKWLAENAIAIIDANDEVRGPPLGDPNKVARFRAAVVRCGELYGQRSRLIHGTWVEGLPDGRPGLSVVRSKWRQPWPSAEKVKPDEIEKLAEDLATAQEELLAASIEVNGILA